MVNYYLNEEKCWGIDENEIQNRIKSAKDKGINIRAIVAINPQNSCYFKGNKSLCRHIPVSS